ncbi:MAG: hypothetical protein RSC43_00305, partial [Clostridia bacterium]
MLRISLWEETFKYLGIEQLIQSITVFDYKFEDSWMTPPVIAALEGLDKGTYLGNSVFKTEFLGIIPVDWLSGGFKNLAIIQNINPSNWEDANLDEHVNEHWGFCGSYMGP